MKQKALAMILAACLFFTNMPAMVYAETGQGESIIKEEEQITEESVTDTNQPIADSEEAEDPTPIITETEDNFSDESSSEESTSEEDEKAPDQVPADENISTDSESEANTEAVTETLSDEVTEAAAMAAANILYSRNVGELTWTIDSDGLLRLTGTVTDEYFWTYWTDVWSDYQYDIKNAIVSISGVTNMYCMFQNLFNLETVTFQNCDTSLVTNMYRMFDSCRRLKAVNLKNINMAKVTDVSYMFYGCHSLSTIDLSGCNLSSVKNMRGMFQECSSLSEINLSYCNLSNAKDLSGMFSQCSSLKTANLKSLNLSKAQNLSCMFYFCESLNSIDLTNVTALSATDMSSMFQGNGNLTKLDLSSFNLSKVDDISSMFSGCKKLSTVITLYNNPYYYDYCFSGAATEGNSEILVKITQNATKEYAKKIVATKNAFDFNDNSHVYLSDYDILYSGKSGSLTWSIDDDRVLHISGNGNYDPNNMGWKRYSSELSDAIVDVTNITNMSFMFSDCQDLKSIIFHNLDTSKVTNMSGAFKGCESLSNLDLSSLNTSKVTNMSHMFEDCWRLKKLDLSSFDTSIVTDMSYMFSNCGYELQMDISGFDTSSVTDMSYMFSNCDVEQIDISGFNTSHVVDMSYMFQDFDCLNDSLDFSKFDTSNVTNMSCMFEGFSYSIDALDLSGFNTSNVTDMSCMFNSCCVLKKLDISTFDTSNVHDISYMFQECTSLSTEITISGEIDNYQNCFFNAARTDDACIYVHNKGTCSSELIQRIINTKYSDYSNIILMKYADVMSDAYYLEAVNWAVEKGITTGKTATSFEPNEKCSRAQIMTFLWRAAGQPEPKSLNNNFTDIKPSDYYYKAVLWAVEKGITTGKTSTTFAPGADCSRAQVVTFMWRAEGKPEPGTQTNKFTDVRKTDYYYKAVLWAVENGITNGKTATTFEPESICTRAQVVTLLHRYYN